MKGNTRSKVGNRKGGPSFRTPSRLKALRRLDIKAKRGHQKRFSK